MKPEWNVRTQGRSPRSCLAKLWGACRVAPASWRPPSAWKIAIQMIYMSLRVHEISNIHLTIDPNLRLQLFATITICSSRKRNGDPPMQGIVNATHRRISISLPGRTSGGAEPSRLHLKKGGSQQKEVVENVGRWMTNEKESGTKWSHHHLRMVDEIRHVIFWIYPFWDFLYSFENAGVPIPASYPSLNISVIATLLVLLCFAYRFLFNPSCYTRYLRLLFTSQD